jgi:hypothetical protein
LLKFSCRVAVLAIVDLGYVLFTEVAEKAPQLAGPSQRLTSPDVSGAAGGGSGGANAIDNACDESGCSCGGSASCALNNLV